MSTLSFILIFILFLLFITLTFTFLYNIYIDAIKKKLTVKKTQWENEWICTKIRWKGKWNRYTNLIWLYPKFIVTVVVAGFFIELILIVINTISSLILALIFFILYIWFIKFVYDKYFEFPKIVAQKLKEHEEAIENAIKKHVEMHDTPIQSFRHQDKHTYMDYKIIKHPKDVEKAQYPPFIDIPPEKRDVVIKRTMQFVVVAPDFLLACPNPTPFNLLKPVREEPKKQCALARKMGACREVYYSQIKTVFYKDQYVMIVFWDEKEEPIKIFVKKPPDSKELVEEIKKRLRITERQRLGKMHEQLIYESILQKREEMAQEKEPLKESASQEKQENNENPNEKKEEKKEENKQNEEKKS